ncbi:Mak10 subunit, NatC N-terminal acetyltransferase-domain-containing protein [Lactarius quietus]|nr:Mak10 subunit, NatC N-terminal acetyltransferase-domain-containing protein [Lactarius quietus]KAF8259492.1 Mak10 subunit, NatC N-terminal acetyltransferase-domain-containing protein [Lactarius quietus]
MSSEPTSWLPGGDDFVDVSDTFLEAAQACHGRYGTRRCYIDRRIYALRRNERSRGNQDAFSPSSLVNAGPVQIGDPRMDSGLILDDEAERVAFSPLTPLLPKKTIACEMEWHAGYTLPQTIYTCLYVHHLTDINPDMIPHQQQQQQDPARPLELVTIVIRAAIRGFLKCCDLAWRELGKGRLHDTEDWHSEKFDVSLLEGTPSAIILSQLEDAKNWIQLLLPESSPWRSALLDRISLRIGILNLIRHHPYKDREQILALLSSARECLKNVRSKSPPEPVPPSPASFAFDSRITRKLNSFMPLRAHQLPPQDLAWDALADMFDGWAKISGDLCANFSRHSQKPPFIRVLFQTVGIEYNTLWLSQISLAPRPLNIERKLSRPHPIRVVQPAASEEVPCAVFIRVAGTVRQQQLGSERNGLHWLSIIEEVLLSGFQLELYVQDEKSFVYWELGQVIHEHLSILDSLERVIPKDAGAYGELVFIRSYLTSFQSLCTGMYMLVLPALHHPTDRLALNFVRRYKWAFRPEYKKLRPQVVIPDLSSFASASVEILKREQEPLRLHFERARDGLAKLDGLPAGLAGPWHEDRLQVNWHLLYQLPLLG